MKFDAIIIGGGMIGMTLALSLRRQHCRCCIVEQGRLRDFVAPAFDGRVSAIALGTTRIFDAVNSWDAMAKTAQPIKDIRIVDGDVSAGDAPLWLHYDHKEVGDEPLGYMVENRHMRLALMQAVEGQENITLYEESGVAAMDVMGGLQQVTLQDGTALSAPLVIAADGKFSATRARAGIDVSEKSYGQQAIVCTVTHAEPHYGMAVERFLPAGPFAILPLPNDETGRHRSSLVWTERARWAPAFLQLPEADFNQEMARRFGDWLGEVSLLGKRWGYPLSLRLAKSMSAERLVLVGDAAHSIHPIAGQGVNLGLRDAAVLAEEVGHAQALGLDIGAPDLLARYAQRRQFDIQAMVVATDKLNSLFANDLTPVRLARRLGLGAVEQLPPVKKLLMRHAMGVLLPLTEENKAG